MPKADTHSEAGAKGGRGKKASVNSGSFTSHGKSAADLLRRLKRDRPELAAKVVSGGLPQCAMHDLREFAHYRERLDDGGAQHFVLFFERTLPRCQ